MESLLIVLEAFLRMSWFWLLPMLVIALMEYSDKIREKKYKVGGRR